MWIKTLPGAEVKVRRDAFVIHFVEREFTNPPGHALAEGTEKRCYREAGKGKGWICGISALVRLSLCLLGVQGWQGLRLEQPQVLSSVKAR